MEQQLTVIAKKSKCICYYIRKIRSQTKHLGIPDTNTLKWMTHDKSDKCRMTFIILSFNFHRIQIEMFMGKISRLVIYLIGFLKGNGCISNLSSIATVTTISSAVASVATVASIKAWKYTEDFKSFICCFHYVNVTFTMMFIFERKWNEKTVTAHFEYEIMMWLLLENEKSFKLWNITTAKASSVSAVSTVSTTEASSCNE